MQQQHTIVDNWQVVKVHLHCQHAVGLPVSHNNKAGDSKEAAQQTGQADHRLHYFRLSSVQGPVVQVTNQWCCHQ
jgi:hypothetical protein